MEFIKKRANHAPIEDNVFCVVKLAQEAIQKYGKDQVVDATIGSLYDEDGKLAAFDTVFQIFDAVVYKRHPHGRVPHRPGAL